MKIFSERSGRIGINIGLIVGMLLLCIPISRAFDLYQHESLTIKMTNVTMSQLFDKLQQQTRLRFVYAHNDIDKYNVEIDASGESLEQILDRVLADKPLTYKITKDNVVISRTNSHNQQTTSTTVTISGRVVDNNGKALVGALIKQKGARQGTLSGASGEFRLITTTDKNQKIILEASFVGYAPVEIECEPGKQVQITLRETAEKMSAVNVISTGVINKPKESFTGAITHVTKEEIKTNYSRNVLQTLTLVDPSFRIITENEFGSDPNLIPKLQLRGPSTFEDLKSLRGYARTVVNNPLFIYDGFEIQLERFMDLSEDEIESITILKDASATALYGSRGANGVIVVTSVKPEPGTITVRYTAKLRIEIPDLSSYNYMDAKQKLEAEALAGVYDGGVNIANYANYAAYYDYLIDQVYNKGVNHDWLREPVRTGIGQSHQLTFTGGDEILRFNARASYDQRVGTMKGSDRNIFNGSLGIIYTKGNLYMSQTLSANITKSNDSPYGTFNDSAKLNPYWTPKDDNGEWNKTFFHPSHTSELHNQTYNGSLNAFDTRYITDYSSNTSLQYTFLEDFRVEGRFSISRRNTTTDAFKPASHTLYLETSDISRKGSYTITENIENKMSGAFNFVFGKTIDRHTINAAVNTEVRITDEDSYQFTGTGYLNDNINHISNALRYAINGAPSGESSLKREVQFMGTVNYYYGGRYFADIMLRTDGASSFGRNSRWSPFYSFGAGWVVSGERFFNFDFVDLLRFKYSYGVSGSLSYTIPQMAMYVLEYDINQLYASGIGAYLRQYGNELLDWQRTYQHNISGDLSMFKGLIDVSGSFYRKMTTGAVEPLALTPSHGYDQFTGNIGDIRNTGWELGVAFYAIRTDDLKIRINPKFSGNKNVVVRLSEQAKANIAAQNNAIGSSQSASFDILKEGQSLRAIYVLNSPGIDPISGRRIYIDGQGIAHFDAIGGVDNRTFAGDGEPKVQSSWFLSIIYKNFSLNAGISARWGGYAYNWTAHNMENVAWVNNLDRRVYSNRWKSPGDNTLLTNIASTQATYKNSQFVEKDNSLTLSSLNLSYELPRTWLKKTLNMKSMRFMVQLSDIWTTSSIWRQRGTTYPYSVNPNFTFECSF